MILTSFILYLLYNVICNTLYGVPENLSSTYYKLGKLKCLFPITMVICVGLLVPGWLDILEGSNWQFLAFLCPMAILFMSMAPDFKNNILEYKVHAISTIIAALLALFSIIFVLNGGYILIFVSILLLLISITSSTLKNCWLYWLEMIIFISTYLSIIVECSRGS